MVGLGICDGCTHCVREKDYDADNPPAFCHEPHVMHYWAALAEREDKYGTHPLLDLAEHTYDPVAGVPLDEDEGDSGPGGLMPDQCIWRSPPGKMIWIEKPGKIMERVLILNEEEQVAPNRLIDVYSVCCTKCQTCYFPNRAGENGLQKGSRGHMNTQEWCCPKCGEYLLLECDEATIRCGVDEIVDCETGESIREAMEKDTLPRLIEFAEARDIDLGNFKHRLIQTLLEDLSLRGSHDTCTKAKYERDQNKDVK